MSDIYRHAWTCPHTGIEYRLDIYAAAFGTPLPGTPSVFDLEYEVVDVVFDGWEYAEGYPIGIHKPNRGKVIFRAETLNSELLGWIMSGSQTQNIVLDPLASSLNQQELIAGTVFDLHARLPGYVDYTRQWTGMQDVSVVVRPDVATDTLEVEIIDVVHCAMKCLQFVAMKNADAIWCVDNPSSVVARQSLIEWVWKAVPQGESTALWWYVAQVCSSSTTFGSSTIGDPDSAVWGLKVQDVLARWASYLEEILTGLVRRTCTVTGLDGTSSPWLRNSLYKLTYNGTDPEPGAQIAVNGHHWAVFLTECLDPAVCDESNVTYSMHDRLKETYDSLWDLFYDVCMQGYVNCALTHFSDVATPEYKFLYYEVLGPLAQASVDFGSIYEPTLHAWKPLVRSRILQKASTSTEFNEGDDYASHDRKTNAGRGDAEIQFPVVLNNSPQALTDFLDDAYRASQAAATRGTTFRTQGTTLYAYNKDLLSTYYLDNPNVSGNAFSEAALIRAHSWQPYAKYGDTLTVPTAGVVTLNDIRPNVGDPMRCMTDGNAIALLDQRQQGPMHQLAEKAYEDFQDPECATCTVTTAIDSIAYTAMSGFGVLLPFMATISRVTLDMSVFKSYLPATPSTFYITKCSNISLKNATMELEMWGKNA